MSKKCQNCGNILEDDVMFCCECGKRYEERNSSNNEKQETILDSTEKTKDEMKKAKQKKKMPIWILVLCSVFVLLIALVIFIPSTETSKTPEEIVAENNYRYFDIVEMINSEQYEFAIIRIEEVYGNTSYSDNSTDSFNKMNLLRMCYQSQELFDNAVNEIMAYLKESNILKQVNSGATNQDDISMSFNTCISYIKELMPLISAENQAKINQLLGNYLIPVGDNSNNSTVVGEKIHTIRTGYTIEDGTPFSDGVALVVIRKDNISSVVAINKKGEILYTLLDNINNEDYSANLNIIEGYKNGVLVIGNKLYDKQGNIIASPNMSGYDEIYMSNSIGFSNMDGYIMVTKYEESIEGEKYLVGVVNNSGNWEIPLSEQGVFNYGNCQFSWSNDTITEKWSEYKYISDSWDEHGAGIYKTNFSGEDELILENFYCLGSYNNGYLMNEEFFIGGQLILQEDEYGDAQYIEGSLGLYDYSGKRLIDLSKYSICYTHGVYYQNNNLLFLTYNGASANYLCFLNDKGKQIIEPIRYDSDYEDDCYYPLDDKGFVFEKAGDSHNRKFYFCDYNGNITEYGDLTAFYGFSEGLALVHDAYGRVCYINHSGKVIIK